jgi:hypothetical protein
LTVDISTSITGDFNSPFSALIRTDRPMHNQ